MELFYCPFSRQRHTSVSSTVTARPAYINNLNTGHPHVVGLSHVMSLEARNTYKSLSRPMRVIRSQCHFDLLYSCCLSPYRGILRGFTI